MKKSIFILLLLMSNFFLFGQLGENVQFADKKLHSKGDAGFYLSGNMLTNEPFGSQFGGGLKMRIFVGQRISFDADLVAGKDYIHFGPGIIGLPLWIFSNELGVLSDEDDSFFGFLFSITMMTLSAEHIAYHFPLKNNTDFSPFVSVLRFKQLSLPQDELNTEDNYAHASFVAGFEINKYFKRFVLSPYIEYNIAYDGYMKGFNLGVNAGYYFPGKR